MIQEKIKSQYPLAELSTYKIGGPAEYFVEVEEKKEIEEALALAAEKKWPVTVLGGGSNILVNDMGVKGLIIRLHNQTLEKKDDKIICGAGLPVRQVAEYAVEHNLTGLEWAIGIPGSMGGAIRGNAGAHGGSFDASVESVVVFDTQELVWRELTKGECGFAYRSSRFKTEPHYIIWEISLMLTPASDIEVMKQKVEEYREYRKTGQPQEPSAGCVFKNFFATDIERMNPALAQRAEQEHKIRGGKIGAGYLIELLKLKGLAEGGAQISEKHANFLINAHNATAADVKKLIDTIKTRVKDEFDVEMEEEIQYLGF